MKRLFITSILIILAQSAVFSQILCIDCFRQNARVSGSVTDKVLNGSFETSNCIPWSYQGVFCPNSSNFSCTVPNWTCTGGGTSSYPMLMTNTVCVIVDGSRAVYMGNGVSTSVCATMQADSSCLASSQCTVPAPPPGFPTTSPQYGGLAGVSIEQPVGGLTIGANYVLEFWAGGEKQSSHTMRGLFAVDIGFGKNFFRCYPTDVNGIGNRFVIQFKASATTHIIKFTNWGHLVVPASEVVLDDIRLYNQSELDESVATCGMLTGLATTDLMTITLAPNPFTDCTELVSPDLRESAVYMYNVSGEEVKSWSPVNTDKLEICREGLPAGIYYLVVENTHKQRSVRKLVIADK